jgi:uncharacterized caspase-like protein
LDSPRIDAAAVAAKLQALGFTVLTGLDLDHATTTEMLRRFQQATAHADTALFFYAGHGLQADGLDYIVPIDADPAIRPDPRQTMIDLSAVLAAMAQGPKINVLFLDAGRDNPLPPDLAASNVGPVDAGLAPGLVISYAAGPGQAAAHGQGDAHSPYTAAILDQLDAPGQEIGELLTRVRLSVIDATDGRQVPWDHSSLSAGFYLVAP